MHRIGLLASLMLFASCGFGRAQQPIDFSRQIRPILSDNCFTCHGPDDKQRKADLRLDVKELALAVIKPGKPDESEFIRRITTGEATERMPPAKSGKKLTPEQIALLRQWIAQGAKWSEHWAFVKPTRPLVPKVQNRDWSQNSIDAFILSRLEREHLKPSPEADRVSLIRRVTLDLTGLPPTPAEVDAFLADNRPGAYERVVDRLLHSPRHGERMAVDWLDASRFADTHGYHIDSGRDMTLWREWVIDAFNHNLPFDRFTIDQLAGDMEPNATLPQKIASGFNRNHMINFEGGAIPQEYLTAYIVDRVNTTSTVWLGLTIGCAQCHDHKFDPITQKEYYQLFAFFNNVPESGLDGSKGNASPMLRVPTGEQQQALDRLAKSIREVDDRLSVLNKQISAQLPEWEKSVAASSELLDALQVPAKIRDILRAASAQRSQTQRTELLTYYRTQLVPEWRLLSDHAAKLRKDQTELEKRIPNTMVMQEMPKPREAFVLVRGEYDKHGQKVVAGVPGALPPLKASANPNRLELARWLVNPSHPLTARVIVNRYWQLYFGTGLVKTAEDFGSQGDWPTHPELLDWLATEFIRSGWDVKHMQRLIVTSAAYRQSSAISPELVNKDPENRLLSRGPRLRLQAEFIRDQALAASGLLYGMIGGHSVSPYQPPGLWEELASRLDGKNWTAQTYTQGHGLDLYRRTMYTFWKRTSPPPTLATFDAPDRETCTVRRARTNTPLQALVLMNDPTYVEAARKLAERVMREASGSQERMILGFRLVTGRVPKEKELAVLEKVYDAQLTTFKPDLAAARKLLTVGEAAFDPTFNPAELAAWTVVANLILNLDETVSKN